MSEETTTPTPGRVDGIRIPKGATHWRCSRVERDGDKRLAFGVVPETGEHLLEAPIGEFSFKTIRILWGDGEYRVHFIARDADGGNPTARGKTDLIRLGAIAPELAPGGAPKPTAAAARFCEACGAGLVPAARFCAACGAAATGGPAPVPTSNAGDPLAFALAFQQAFTAGQTSALALVQQVTQQVATHEEARTRRYQADVQERIERDRQAHERAMREQEEFYKRTAAPALDPDALMKPLRNELKAINAKVDELAAEEEEEEDDEPIGEPSEGASTLAANVTAFTAAAEKAAPMLGSVLSGAVDAYTKLRANGAASAGS